MLYYFFVMNIVSFFLFGVDKQKSKKKEYRIPERYLLGSAWIGGSFGALFAMFYFHHKNRKGKFLLVIPLTCILWTFLLWLFK